MDEAVWQLLLALLFGAVLVEGVILVGVTRQVGAILLQIGPPRPGSVEGGPNIGSPVTISGLDVGSHAILVFVSQSCGPCERLRPSFPSFVRHHRDFRLVPVLVGEVASDEAHWLGPSGPGARTDLAHLYEDWNIPGTPFAVGLDAQGIVRATGVVNNLDQLESLAESVRLADREDLDADDEIAALDVTRRPEEVLR